MVGVFGVLAGVLVALSPSFDFQRVNGELELVTGPPLVGPGLGVILGSVLVAVALFAFAELIQVLLDMAADMRTTAAYFERREAPGGEQRQRTTAHPLARRPAPE